MLSGKKFIGTVAYLGGVMSLPEPFVWSWTQMLQYNADYCSAPNEAIHYNRATVSFHGKGKGDIPIPQRALGWLGRRGNRRRFNYF